MAPLGITTAIDLRSSEEVGQGAFAGDAEPVRHLPIFEVGPEFSEPIEDVAQTLADAYLWMLSEGSGSMPKWRARASPRRCSPSALKRPCYETE